MNKRHYEHTLPIIRGSLSNTYLEPLKGIASNPDRQRILKDFFKETYV